MRCYPYSLISACVMLICAAIKQALQGYPDALSVSFLLLGVTSVIHHCRLDTWWIYDIWRVFDYIMIVIFSLIASSSFFRHWLWLITCLILFILTAAIWTRLVPYSCVPLTHSFMHFIVTFSIIYLK